MTVSVVTRPTLLARVRRAEDNQAWRQFESIYGSLIIRYCRRCGLQLADAEDVCQVVMAKLARSLRSFEYDSGRGRFRDYLGRAARNALASHFSSHKSTAATVSLIESAEAASPDDESDAMWRQEWMQHHYRLATRTLRKVVDERTLAIFDGLLTGRSQDQIAAEFSASPEAIRKIKQRVRDRLREIIARQIQDEELSIDKCQP